MADDEQDSAAAAENPGESEPTGESGAGKHPVWAIWRWALHWQVLLGIVLGIVCGLLSGLTFVPDDGDIAGRWDMTSYAFIGDVFMNALKLLVVPLIATSIISAMASLGRRSGFARLGGKTLLFYLCTSLFAILIGLLLVNAIDPGIGAGLTPEEASAAAQTEGSAEAANLAKIEQRTEGRDTGDILNVLKTIVPSNIVVAAGNPGDYMLGIIFFSLLFGIFINRLGERERKVMVPFWNGAYQVMLRIALFVLAFLPIGVLGLIAKTTADAAADGVLQDRLGQLGWFAGTVVAALLIHAVIVMPLILILVAKVNPFRHFRAVAPALMTAFSSASSAGTLPVTLDCVQRRAGVSQRVGSFVLPVGATVNMDGTALYECVAVIFLAQLHGIGLGFGDQFVIVALALLTSIGVAGIPSASLVAIVIILNAVNARLPMDSQIPIYALSIILIFDRLLDMCRTAVNVLGDSVGAVTIARSEGEDGVLRIDPGIAPEPAPALRTG